MDPHNGWEQYQKLVLFRLDEQAEKLICIDRKLSAIDKSVSLLKYKVAVIGSAGGAFMAAVLHWIF